MNKIHVGTIEPYNIYISQGILKDTGRLIKDEVGLGKDAMIAIVTDITVGPLYIDILTASLDRESFHYTVIELPAGEETKSSEYLMQLYKSFAEIRLTRTDLVIALGGGVIGDVAGFAAATYLRGVPYVQVPTTLLAQVDSSIGGKVAINLPYGKNLVGAFYQPVLVVIDLLCLNTLDERQFGAGMAEVVKYGAIYDSELFGQLEDIAAETKGFTPDRMEMIVSRCCEIKRHYVENDPLDKGIRMELNFGHTLGHALEKGYGFGSILHGEGVAFGMIEAAQWGEMFNISPPGTKERIEKLLIRTTPQTMNIAVDSKMTDIMMLDKKTTGDNIRLILLESIGKARIHSMAKERFIAFISDIYGDTNG